MGSATPCIALIYIDLGAERALRRVWRSPQTNWCHGRSRELEPRGVCQRPLPSLTVSHAGVSSTRLDKRLGEHRTERNRAASESMLFRGGLLGIRGLARYC